MSLLQEGLTALVMAAKKGYTTTVNTLLKGDANANIQEKVSLT